MTLSQQDLQSLWHEGPVFAYRQAIERLQAYADDTNCPATLPAAQVCWDLRLATIGLLRLEADHLERVRTQERLDPRSWLGTSRPINAFACVVLDGAR